MWIKNQNDVLINLDNVDRVKREDNILYAYSSGNKILIAKYNNGYQAYKAIQIVEKNIKNETIMMDYPKM